MEDKIKTQRINNVGCKKLRGEVLIQVLDSRTDKVIQEVKGKNMVTNAIRDVFASNYFGLMSYQNLLPIRDLFGGVLCFRNALTEDADDYYPPLSATNPVTAHAGQTTYASADADTTRGIPNSVESGVVTGGYKFVWDFASTQGNGTISALALTHKDTGDFWLNGGSSFEPIKLLDYPSGNAFLRQIECWDDDNRTAYAFEGNGTTLNLVEYKDYSSILGVGINEANLLTRPEEAVIVGTHTYTLPRDWSVMRFLFLKAEREIHALYPTGNTIERVIIDLSDFSSTRSDITLANDVALQTYSEFTYSHTFSLQLDDDGYLYMQSTTNTKKYKIKYSSPSNVVEVTAPAAFQDSKFPFTGIGHFGLAVTGTNGIIIDGATAHACGINQANNSDNYLDRWRSPIRGSKSPVFYMPCQRRNEEVCASPRLALCKLYMATIKNLEEPVTKSSTNSMKITYTITEEEES